jgi:hypothetical protein
VKANSPHQPNHAWLAGSILQRSLPIIMFLKNSSGKVRLQDLAGPACAVELAQMA